MTQKYRLLRGVGAIAALFWVSVASGSPHESQMAKPSMAQYCVDGWNAHGPRFCMALNMYHNHSTAAHDMYITVQVHRPADASVAGLGWLALGSGPAMSGSLMFVIYGDPITGTGPFVSGRGIRLGRGHAQPHILSPHDADQNGGGVLVQQLGEGRWARADDSDDDASDHVGVVQLVCYGCDRWDGHPFQPEETSQSMIWAFNSKQDMAPYTGDRPLEKHVGAGGHGNFFANLAAATTHDASGPPQILSGEANERLNTAGHRISVPKPTLLDQLRARPAAYAHASVMLLAFLVLFPLGVAGIRSGLAGAFRYHWKIQTGAICLAVVGAGLGLSLFLSSGSGFFAPGSTHERVGLATCGLLLAQATSGWWHHVRFVRVRRRTWVSYAHMALGWAILSGGWANAVTGARLFGGGRLVVALVVVVIAAEVLVLATMSCVARRKRVREQAQAKAAGTTATGAVADWREEDSEDYFVLDEVDSEEEEGTERKSDEKLRPAKYHA